MITPITSRRRPTRRVGTSSTTSTTTDRTGRSPRCFFSFDEGSRFFQIEIPRWRGAGTRTWDVTVSYYKSGMEPRPSDDVDSLYEFDITPHAEEERTLPLQVKPRLGWDACPDRRPQSVPNDLGEAVCVHINNSPNVELDQIRYLVPLLLKGTA